MRDFIKVIPSAISDADCIALINEYPEYTEFKNSNIRDRNDRTVALGHRDIEDTEETTEKKKHWCSKILSMVSEETYYYLEDYGQSFPFPLEMIACQLQKSTAEDNGGYHSFHFEAMGAEDDETTRRMLVWMIYLNDVPVGEGETEFLYQGIRLQPKRGDLIIWPAGFTHTHRGNPVYTTDKYILTGWQCWPTQENAQAFMANQHSQKEDIRYITRHAETAVAVPADVTTARAAAREAIV